MQVVFEASISGQVRLREASGVMNMRMLNTVRSLTYLAAMVLAAQVQPLAAQIPGNEVGGPLEPHPAADEAIARIKSPY